MERNHASKDAIGCISPYKRQVTLLNKKLKDQHGHKHRDHVTIDTVDAFQVGFNIEHLLILTKGQEKDVIIFSTVRAHSRQSKGTEAQNLIGFLSDVRRLNVAITRPKFMLLVIGNIFL